MQPLITKYRPVDFDEMVGHELTLTSLQRALSSDTRPHAYLMTGPAGLGKTTLARIIATSLQCEVTEIDAASHSGIDDMRALVELGNHRSLSGAGQRAFIVDECHALSKPAWQAILKILEEPPAHLFLMLCTTERKKVPDTIVSRCYHVELRPLKTDEMDTLLTTVAEMEGWEVAPSVMTAVLQASTGQPRKGLSLLQSVHDVADGDEVKRIISLQEASDEIMQICKLLIRGQTKWILIRPLLQAIDDSEFEDGLIGAGRYIAAIMASTSSDAEAARCYALLDAITFPTTTYDKKIHFYTAVGRMCFGGG